MRSNLVDVEVQLVHATEKAYLLKSVITEVEAWIPKSVCEVELEKGDIGTVTMSQNLAEEKRLV